MAYIFDYGVGFCFVSIRRPPSPLTLFITYAMQAVKMFSLFSKKKAKLRASLKWIFVKAYCNAVPLRYQEPYFEENEVKRQ